MILLVIVAATSKVLFISINDGGEVSTDAQAIDAAYQGDADGLPSPTPICRCDHLRSATRTQPVCAPAPALNRRRASLRRTGLGLIR